MECALPDLKSDLDHNTSASPHRQQPHADADLCATPSWSGAHWDEEEDDEEEDDDYDDDDDYHHHHHHRVDERTRLGTPHHQAAHDSSSAQRIALEIPQAALQPTSHASRASEADSVDTAATLESWHRGSRAHSTNRPADRRRSFFGLCSCRRSDTDDVYGNEPQTPRTPRRTPTKCVDRNSSSRTQRGGHQSMTNSKRIVESFEINFMTPKHKSKHATGFNIDHAAHVYPKGEQNKPTGAVQFEDDMASEARTSRAGNSVIFADGC